MIRVAGKTVAVGIVAGGLLALGATAAAAAPAAPHAGTRRPLSATQHRVDQRMDAITARAQAERKRVDTRPAFTAADKSTLDADLNKVVADAAAARHAVDAAKDKAAVVAAKPLLLAVHNDHLKLANDLKVIRAAHK